jgi:AAA+ ATPase superfamily predicted ATPase
MFSFGDPIEPPLFFNREKELAFLTGRMLNVKKGVRQNIALLGARRMGKSSLLLTLAGRIKKQGVIPVRIDCEGKAYRDLAIPYTSVAFLKEYYDRAIDAYLEHAPERTKIPVRLTGMLGRAKEAMIAALSSLAGYVQALEIKALKETISFRIEFEKKREHELGREDVMNFFETAINLPERLAAESGVCFAVMLDEFQEIKNFYLLRKGDIFSNLRRHIQFHKRVAYVVSGSKVGIMRDILLKRESALGANFYIMSIEPFSQATAVKFLKAGFTSEKRRCDEEAITEVVRFSGASPAYLNWIGLRCVEKTGKGDRITLQLVQSVEEEMLNPTGIAHLFRSDLDRLLKFGKAGWNYRILIEMSAHGLARPTDVAHAVGITTAQASNYMNRLEQYGFLRRENRGIYSFEDGLLREYIKKKVHIAH